MEERLTIADVEMSRPGEEKLARDGVLNQIETLMKRSDRAGGNFDVATVLSCHSSFFF